MQEDFEYEHNELLSKGEQLIEATDNKLTSERLVWGDDIVATANMYNDILEFEQRAGPIDMMSEYLSGEIDENSVGIMREYQDYYGGDIDGGRVRRFKSPTISLPMDERTQNDKVTQALQQKNGALDAYNFMKNLSAEQVKQVTGELSRIQYFDDPYIKIAQENKPDVYMLGNEDTGFVLVEEGRVIDRGEVEPSYTISEAQVTLQNFLREFGEDFGYYNEVPPAQWQESGTLPNIIDYQELTVLAPQRAPTREKPDFIPWNEGTHRMGINSIGHVQLSTRNLVGNKKTMHIEAIQSDLMQSGQGDYLPYQKGWRAKLLRDTIDVAIKNDIDKISWSPSHIQEAHWDMGTDIHVVADNELMKEVKKLEKEYGAKFSFEELKFRRNDFDEGFGYNPKEEVYKRLVSKVQDNPQLGTYASIVVALDKDPQPPELTLKIPTITFDRKAISKWKRLGRRKYEEGGVVTGRDKLGRTQLPSLTDDEFNYLLGVATSKENEPKERQSAWQELTKGMGVSVKGISKGLSSLLSNDQGLTQEQLDFLRTIKR